ncbi:MAG: homoserine kinase [Chloroflexota bacterium]|nr:homoserine kinase [Chloroflexota bacterium]
MADPYNVMDSFQPFEVVAPATTANLGPGFDCLGMALDLWNRLEVVPVPAGSPELSSVEIVGEGEDELASDASNLTIRALRFLFDEAGLEMPGLRLRCQNVIPLSRGMGSSAAAIAGGLVAANHLCGHQYSRNELLEMAATIEGHPDNVAAAVLGGLQLVVSDGPQLYTAPIPVPEEIQAVLFIPEARIATSDARAVLPGQVSVADAVFNMGRVALLVAGMSLDRPEYLDVATQDRLHQPYRQPLFPAIKLIFAAARDAGALGVFLSGSGSTVLALTRGREMTVAYEMFEAARLTGVSGKVEITRPTSRGAHVVGKD